MAKSSHVDRTVKTTQDDFASMRELVFRRVVNKDRPKPDLLLIDGGKGQLSAALDALKLGKIKIPVVALAKKEEVLFFESLGNARDKLKSGSPSDRFDSLTLPHDSEALLLLMAIRDEVHRFGLSFHRHRRSKALLS